MFDYRKQELAGQGGEMMKTEQHIDIRLRPLLLPEDLKHAIAWYQDEEVLYYSEGIGVRPYNEERLELMYGYLSRIGKVYIIEAIEEGLWQPIGDITLSEQDLPIAIGHPDYRSKGIGRKVLQLIQEEARRFGWTELKVKMIYDYNERSKRLFTSMGFEEKGQGVDSNGVLYRSYVCAL
ncbi:GNAT family N-acetyltransferase [Paenibacillus aquistagni]|nr:GNAT family N-acetyltransferase [Paenibacillus aquistagni]